MAIFRGGQFYPASSTSRVWKGWRWTTLAPDPQLPPSDNAVVAMRDVAGLETALANKSDLGHGHGIGDITPQPLTSPIDGGTFF